MAVANLKVKQMLENPLCAQDKNCANEEEKEKTAPIDSNPKVKHVIKSPSRH